jgi:adenylate cyclase
VHVPNLITLAVMTFVAALAALLIAIQVRSLSWAAHEAASTYMDAASTKALGRLRSKLNTIASVVNVLATSSSVADSNERSETGRAIPLFKAALQEMPQMDSIYAGFENGAWLQVRRTNDLNEDQRARLRAPASADLVINLIRPTPAGNLPMRRIFQDRQSNDISEIDLWMYGYDARRRPWYTQTMTLDRAHVTEPYLSFSLGAPVITVSAPLRGKVAGVLAADLKLDTFSDFVQSQRPGPHGTVMIFDQMGSLIAHPDFAKFVSSAMTDPGQSNLPNIDRIKSGIVASVLKEAPNVDINEGTARDEDGKNYLLRLTKFTLGEGYNASILLLAAQDDFVQNVRKLQLTGLILAIVVSAAFSNGLDIRQPYDTFNAITARARKLQMLAEPDPASVTSHITEINELGNTVNPHRAIWSFAHFIPKEIVRRVLDNSISTKARRRQTGDHACLHRCPRLYHDCGVCRFRRTDAANVALLLRANRRLPRRGRHDRQIYRRRGHGVLERSESAARPCSSRLPCRACGPSRRRAAKRRI